MKSPQMGIGSAQRLPAGDESRRKVMNQDGGQRLTSKPDNESTQHLSARGLFIVFGGLAAALVLGYLLVSKLVDISQEEDCALAHRYNCGAVEVPR